jgi:DNA polymerase/3'-5' exonuclease PolX
MLSNNEVIGDNFRIRAYRTAIASLKKLDFRVVSVDDIKERHGFGERITAKISEILLTGKLRASEITSDKIETMRLFQGVYGVGANAAERFWSLGFRTLDDLRNYDGLTIAQKIGLKHYDDLRDRIPRDEVQKIGDVVLSLLHILDSESEGHIMGSFRRGTADCGDIDILITHPRKDARLLQDLLEKIRKTNPQFLIVDLMEVKLNQTIYRGICRLDGGRARRLDLLFVPYHEMGAACMRSVFEI